MSGRAHQGVMMAALAVAMGAMINDLDPMDVDDLMTRAGQLLPDGDPLGRAISRFATQHMLARYDAGALAAQGELLRHAVELALIPVPPDMGRADIHG